MTEYTAHYQKGTRVGARSLRLITVEAADVLDAARKSRREVPDRAYRLIRVDHYDEDGHLVID